MPKTTAFLLLLKHLQSIDDDELLTAFAVLFTDATRFPPTALQILQNEAQGLGEQILKTALDEPPEAKVSREALQALAFRLTKVASALETLIYESLPEQMP